VPRIGLQVFFCGGRAGYHGLVLGSDGGASRCHDDFPVTKCWASRMPHGNPMAWMAWAGDRDEAVGMHRCCDVRMGTRRMCQQFLAAAEIVERGTSRGREL
jgi:hypothetical protein